MTEQLLKYDDLFKIPEAMMPMPVLSDNVRSVISGMIKVHSKGMYNHFMWLTRPGVLATQNVTGFKALPLKAYTKRNRLKLFWFPTWEPDTRQAIIAAIDADLAAPWYKRRYDFLAYLGHVTGIQAIHSPWSEICSEKARYIPGFDLTNPTPQDVNAWLERSPDAQVYGRYTPD